MLKIEYQDSIAVVKLNRGVTNALNPELVDELQKAILDLKFKNQIRAMVLTSSNDKFFSIGFDIPQLIELSQEDFQLYYQKFNQMCLALYTFPKPTVAAVVGHAIAGGCILALCCDYRVIADERSLMGLNEIKLGVPVPYLADCILRSLVGVRSARQIMETGEFYSALQLFQMGMVDQLVSLEEVLPTSMERASALGIMPQEAYKMIKKNRVEVIRGDIQKNWDEKKNFFIKCWYSEEAQKLLKKAMEKF
ncbi:MAG: enoyl-CoA hydratase/isomerase family protein [Candidatus Aminicenantes bacterium]|nr:enoyl-CoA hydratase/isomerase family protein [Candidatus Aminicenantes bacterium]